ncbi:TetR/AcrR family transcriptional regulator [Nocardia vaccinii]|uniref:TetR/AcrR family transcriptional regulator n=1 Tax=Nocardia vaccinii TaxID=1822 RepID=UPI0008322828|nr:TetR/AcrR family transcriptional regulator [Nocardia vaccinii]
MTHAESEDTRATIISAAYWCFRNQGLRKATVVDIARAADVSRSTFYEYFSDKAALVEACAEAASQRFYRNMAKAISSEETLVEKLAGAAVFVTRARRIVETELYFDDAEVGLLLTKNGALLLQECAEFLAPHLIAARLTGEVRKDLDIMGAAEWFSRILFSLFSTPSPLLDMNDDEAVAGFVRAHAVSGFIEAGPQRQRRAKDT